MNSHSERVAGLAFLPIVVTGGFYVLPLHWQSNVSIQFIPQMCAYLVLGLWAFQNTNRIAKLGLEPHKVGPGLQWGIVTGILLGGINSLLIIFLIPALGGNIEFLRDTPHAQIPFLIMVPWFILCIACAIELNFRGFILGRLLTVYSTFINQRHLPAPILLRVREIITSQNSSQDLGQIEPICGSKTAGVAKPTLRILRVKIGSRWPEDWRRKWEVIISRALKLGIFLPLLLSALSFSFDPFMVATFGDLHWIAVWDGLIWGWMWIRMTNLYAVIIAHAVEVLILYLTVRAALL